MHWPTMHAHQKNGNIIHKTLMTNKPARISTALATSAGLQTVAL